MGQNPRRFSEQEVVDVAKRIHKDLCIIMDGIPSDWDELSPRNRTCLTAFAKWHLENK